MKSVIAKPSSPSFWHIVLLLLRTARKRAGGRLRRQQELLRHRTGKKTTISRGHFGFVLTVIFMAGLNIGAAYVVRMAVGAGERIQAEHDGKIVVNHWFLEDIADYQNKIAIWIAQNPDYFKGETSLQWLRTPIADSALADDYSYEANEIVRTYGGSPVVVENDLRNAVHANGAMDLISIHDAVPGFAEFSYGGILPAMLGCFVLFGWALMVVLQGEGLELDLQRRRHPMWEWLFSHPAPAAAIFTSEMLSPIAANPIYWGAPLFAGFLYGFIYGPGLGCLAGFLVGIPVTIAAACLGKALEIAIILRFSPRSRGAMIGLMGWLGYASMMIFILCGFNAVKIFSAIGGIAAPLAKIPWPWLGLFLGAAPGGGFSFVLGLAACWVTAGVTMVVSVGFGIWGAQKGLEGHSGRGDTAPLHGPSQSARFGKEPLYRKELLWLMRDRSAIVQAILVPLTMASFQIFNMRGLLAAAQNSWNFLGGAAILFGTYILWILGPKSLASEGAALWITLTWPRGLESLLRAKAWLWALISTGIVLLILIYAAFLYPASIWKIDLLGIGWWFFARSMAEKAVTLVTVTSASGEAEKIPTGRRWAAQLGMFTFSIGVLTQQWNLAVVGIVYSYVTAAAMWQNFRARMPYLYDVWSETLPPPPTLMHAMIAISILVESGAVLSGVAFYFVGRDNIATALVLIYAVCALIVSLGVWKFLEDRGVPSRDVWCWPQPQNSSRAAKPWWSGDGRRGMAFFRSLLSGLAGGLMVGLIGLGYIAVLHHIPYIADSIRQSQLHRADIPGLLTGYRICAIALAPFAEEYLFRGLLFRALDREWGGWRAVLGSATFFAIFHPPLSWLPVGLLGITNALLFKHTGRLAPSVISHTVYNVIVLG